MEESSVGQAEVAFYELDPRDTTVESWQGSQVLPAFM